MLNDIKSFFAFFLFVLLLGLAACSEDPATPDETKDLEIEVLSPYWRECPDAAFTIRVESNLPLARVEFRVDGEVVFTDHEAPFEYLWNIALWADGSLHYLWANGFDLDNRIDSGRGISFTIPVGTGGVLVAPSQGGGVSDPTEATLRWLRDPHEVEYEAALSLQPDFTTITHSATTIDTALTVPVTEQEWQYWRVRQRTGENPWGPWSETGVFYGGSVFDRDYVYPGSNKSYGRVVRQTADGGFLIAGFFGDTSRPLVRRLDALGNPVWTYEPYIRGYFNDLVVTDDGGCVLVGSAYPADDSNLILTRLDGQGREIWDWPYYGSEGADGGNCVIQCASGGFVVAGLSQGAGAWLMKVDDEGRLVWEETYGLDSAEAVVEMPDGGFVFTGGVNGGHLHLTATDPEGNQLWQSGFTYGQGIDLVATESYIATLNDRSQLQFFDLEGQFESEISLGLTGYYSAFERTPNGGLCIAGESDLVCLGPTGQEVWRRVVEATAWSLCPTADGGFVFTGYRRQPSTQNHMWVLKTNADGISTPPVLD